MSSICGKNIKVSVFGQSHSPAIGVTVDGLPAGLKVDLDEIHAFMQRRAPGNASFATSRKEADEPQFIAGIVNGYTCGAPLTAIIQNTNTRSSDYEELKRVPRPAHADFTAEMKYGGYQDVAGGGHFSGRLTAPLCIAGTICLSALKNEGISVFAHIASIKKVLDTPFNPIAPVPPKDLTFPLLDDTKKEEMLGVIEHARKNLDSVGGTIECAVTGLPVGLGEPMFDGIENRISQIIFGIPAIKGIEFGNGFGATLLYGSQNNDPFVAETGAILTKTNNHGGILGGITSGMPLLFKVAVKPTPSIGSEQKSVDLETLEETTLKVKGRHDPCIVPRAVPCVEAAAAIAVYDALLD